MFKQTVISGDVESGAGNTCSRHSLTASPPQDSFHSGWPSGGYQGPRPTSVPVSGVFQPPSIPDSLMTDAFMNQYSGLLRSGRNSSIGASSAAPPPPPPPPPPPLPPPMHFQEYETLSSIEATMQGCYQGLLAQRRLSDFEFCERRRQTWDNGGRSNEGVTFNFTSGGDSADNGVDTVVTSIANANRESVYCEALGKD